MLKTTHTRPLSGLILTAAFIITAVANANPALQEALDNYQNSRFEIACKQFNTLAEMGFSTAQYNLGVMYLKGQSVEQDLSQAYAWIALAAEQQSSLADTASTALQALPDAAAKKSAQAELAALQQRFGVGTQIDQLLQTPANAEQQQQPFELVKTQAPIYPANALTRHLGGYNMTEFWVFPDGSVRLPSVIYSMPGELFDDASLQAIARFKLDWSDNSVADSRPTVARQVIDYRLTAKQKSRPTPQILNHIKNIRKRVESGDAYAKYSLAVGHLYLDISDLDDRQAEALLLEAAWAGIPEAQHMVGMRLLQDWRPPGEREHGRLWINMAALGDYPAISYSVARNGLDSHATFAFDDLSNIDLITHAANMGYAPAVIHHSLITATASKPPQPMQIDQAREQLQAISGWYRDEPYWYVASAAVAAAAGDFAVAAELQQKAIRKAAALNWETVEFEQALADFEQNKRLITAPNKTVLLLAATPDSI